MVAREIRPYVEDLTPDRCERVEITFAWLGALRAYRGDMRLAAVSISFALAGTAAAQPSLVEPTPVPAAVPQSELSETTALALSVGGTAASWALLIGGAHMDNGRGSGEAMATIGAIGTFIGPSFGHWYAGSFATRGLGLRFAGMVALTTGVMVALTECPIFSDDCQESGIGPTLVILGAGAYIAGTIDDIMTAPGKARRKNERFNSVQVVPIVNRASAGAAVVGRF